MRERFNAVPTRRGAVLFAVLITAGAAALVLGAGELSRSRRGESVPRVQAAREIVAIARKVRPADLPHNPLVGLAVVCADGREVGTVLSIDAEPDGKISAINVRAGGFFGLGARMVAIPAGKFERASDRVRLSLTAREVGALPTLW